MTTSSRQPFLSTWADWADTASAAGPALVVPVVAAAAEQPSVVAVLAGQPVAALAVAVRPSAEAVGERPVAGVAVEQPVAAAEAGWVAAASLRPLAESLADPAPAHSAAESGFARPAVFRVHPAQAAHLADSAGPAPLAR